MGFQDISNVCAHHGRKPLETIRASVSAYRSRPFLKVHVGRPIADSLGWELKTRLKTEIGFGPDAGLVRVTANQSGRAQLHVSTAKAKSFFFSLPAKALGYDKPLKTTVLEHIIDGNALMFRLPEYPEEPAPRPSANSGLHATQVHA